MQRISIYKLQPVPAVCAEVLSVLEMCAQQDLGDVLCSHIGQSCLEEATTAGFGKESRKRRRSIKNFTKYVPARRGEEVKVLRRLKSRFFPHISPQQRHCYTTEMHDCAVSKNMCYASGLSHLASEMWTVILGLVALQLLTTFEETQFLNS